MGKKMICANAITFDVYTIDICHSTCEVALGKRYRMQNFTDIPFIYAKIQPVTKYVTRSRRMLYLCAVAGKKHWPRLDTCRKFDPE